MTVQTEISRSGPYAGAGTTGPFTAGFRFLADAHLLVIRTSSTGADTTLALTTDYTVTGAGGSSGSVTLVAALAVGESLTIVRNVPFTQLADYVDNDAFPAESHENALDLLTMQTQQNKDSIDRSLTLAITASGVSTELPSPEGGTLIGWNGAGDALLNYDAGALGVSISYAAWYAEQFNGTGVAVAFVLSSDAGVAANCDVSVGGVAQVPGVNFSYTQATQTITFLTGAPVAGTGNISVRYGQALPVGIANAASISDSTATGRALVTAASAATGRATLGAAESGANSDLTSLSGLTTPLSVAQGGTGATSGVLVYQSSSMPSSGSYTAGVVVLESSALGRISGWKRLTTGSGHVLNTDWLYFTNITSGTAVATTSGTSIDFTGIPAGVKRLTVMFNSVSTNGTALFLLQIGSGSVETTGYVSGAGGRAGETTSTAGFVLNPTGSAGSAFSGHNTITLLGSNLWVSSGILPRAGTGGDGFGNVSGGTKTTAGTLDRLRFTTVGGTDVFDLGSVNIFWEF